MKKRILTLLAMISLLIPNIFIDSVYAYRPSNPPRLMKDIDIEDENTGLRIRDYYYLLPEGKFSVDIANNNGWIDQEKNTFKQESLPHIKKMAEESIDLKVTELSKDDEIIQRLYNAAKDKLLKDPKNQGNEVLSCYKVDINKKGFEKYWVESLNLLPRFELVIPLRYRNKNGEQKNPHYENNIVIYTYSKVGENEYITEVNPKETGRYYNIPARGEDDIVIDNVRPGNYVLIGTGKMSDIPDKMAPGIYKTDIRLRHYSNIGGYSMGAPAIKKEAKIEVDKYGNRSLLLTAQPMTFSGINGHLLNVLYKKGDRKYKAEILDTYVDEHDGQTYPKTFKMPILSNDPVLKVEIDADAMNKPEIGIGTQPAEIAINVDIFNGKAGLSLEKLNLEGKFKSQPTTADNSKNFTDESKVDSKTEYIITSKEKNLVDIEVKNCDYYLAKDYTKIVGEIYEKNQKKKVEYDFELIDPVEKEVFKGRKRINIGKKIISNHFIIKNVDLAKVEGPEISSICTMQDCFILNTNTNKYEQRSPDLNKINYYKTISLNEKPVLNTAELNKLIEEAGKIKQDKKSKEAFDELKSAITKAEKILTDATEQTQLDNAKRDLETAIAKFTSSKDQSPQINNDEEKNYNLPVEMKHLVEDQPSMGAGALISPAKVSIKGNTATIDLTFKGLNLMGLYGHLTDAFTYTDNDRFKNTIKMDVVESVNDTDLNGKERSFPKVMRFTMDKDKFMEAAKTGIYLQVWVDAMDSLNPQNQNINPNEFYDNYTKGVGRQTARLFINTSKMKENENQPNPSNPNNPSNPSNPSTPGYSFQNLAIERSALGSAMASASASMSKGADSNLVAAMARAGAIANNPYASREEILSATQALNNAVIANKGSMNKQNNNSSWGNNNQGWGNNNQGWGNNSGWGNNNSSWGSYGNNNRGWNNNSSWGVYNNNQNNQNNQSNKNNGPVTIQYEVPVEVLHAYQDGYSMANGAINHIARVEERNGQFRYSVQFNPLQRDFNGQKLVGNLTHLFIHDGNKYLAEQSSGNVWSWVMNGKYDKVNVSVKVDIMDQIAVNEQKAILSFNWNNAREVGRVGGNNNNQNQQNQNQQNQQKQAPQVAQNNNASNNFTDISGHWAKTAIDYVVSKGYFAGLSNTEFGPNKSITRGQFVSVLGRMLNVNVNDYKDQNFKDVKSGMYYSPYITWANKVGIVSGVGQGNFAPDKELTREEMAVMMTKFLKVSGKNLNAKGNTNGFKDEEKIQSWAKDSVKEMARLGVVSGMGDGSFAPKSQFTRAQVAQVLYNIDHN